VPVGLAAILLHGSGGVNPSPKHFLDSRDQVRGCGALKDEAGSASIANLRNDGRFVMNTQDDEPKLWMPLHQASRNVRFAFTG
jgi:hypothetical protein